VNARRVAVAAFAIAATTGVSLPLGVFAHTVATVAATLVGSAWVAVGVRRNRPVGLVWSVLAASAALNVVCTLVWYWPVLAHGGDPLPQPSLPDAGWVLSDLLLGAGLVLALTRRERPLTVLLDVAAIVVGAGLVIGVLLVGPDLAHVSAPLDLRVSQVAYVAVDVLLIAGIARALLAPHGRPAALWLLVACATALVTSDILWNRLMLVGTYVPGTWADIGWGLYPLALGLAALHPSMARLSVSEERADGELRATGALVLGLVSLIAPLLLTAHSVLPSMPNIDESVSASVALLGGGAILAAIVMGRFLLLVRRARRLAEHAGTALDERSRMLDRSEARFRDLVEQVPAVVVLFALVEHEPGPVPVYVSPQAEAILGIDPQEWLRDPAVFGSRIHPEDLVLLQMKLAQQATGAAVRAVEFRFQRPDGVEIWLRDVSGAMRTELEGRYLQTMLVDITEGKRAETEHERMEGELRLAHRLEAVGQLASGIAHEINTPIQFVGDTFRFLQDAFGDLLSLTAIQSELREAADAGTIDPMLLKRVHLAEEAADVEYLRERVPGAFERGVHGISRVTTIVRAMRDYAHPPTAERIPTDVAAALRNTLVVATNEYKYVADVETDFDALPSVRGNGGELQQVFLNLIVNAAHAIESVVGESGRRGVITISACQDGDDVLVSIADTGCGIPPEVANRVFDPFFTTKEVGRGTGQGLALARTMVVEGHGGALTFETVLGTGTTFHVRLPIGATEKLVEAA
jgi:PAS domain S-box-containing protein